MYGETWSDVIITNTQTVAKELTFVLTIEISHENNRLIGSILTPQMLQQKHLKKNNKSIIDIRVGFYTVTTDLATHNSTSDVIREIFEYYNIQNYHIR